MFLKIMVWLILITQIADMINGLKTENIKPERKLERFIVNATYVYAAILIVIRLGI